MTKDTQLGNYLPILQVLVDAMGNNFTQKELATTFDCSVKTIRAFLKGELIKWEYLFKLSCILNMEIEINFIAKSTTKNH